METAITEQGVTRRFRRVTEAVPAARAFVRRWLPRSAQAEGLVLAAAEAMNNAIDHAHGDHFVVAVQLDGAVGTVTVIDDGPGFDPPDQPTMPDAGASRHRGLAMMHAFADHVAIDSSSAGTTVTLMHSFDRARAPGPDGATGRRDAARSVVA